MREIEIERETQRNIEKNIILERYSEKYRENARGVPTVHNMDNVSFIFRQDHFESLVRH